MIYEDTEAVEATTADAAPEGASEAPVESVEAEVSDEPAEAAEASEESQTTEAAEETEPEAEAPQVIDWNGELESLKTSDWFERLDESTRAGLLQGLETKYQNWQRGYTSKFQDISKQRREVDAMLKDVRENEMRVQKWLHGDVDPLKEKQSEIDEMKVAHRAALATLRAEFEEAQEKLANGHTTSVEEATKARDEALARVQEFETAAAKAEEARIASAVDEFETWMKEKAPDIYENEEALKALCVLCTPRGNPDNGDYFPGYEADTALAMVRAQYPLQEAEPEPEPEPEAVPEGMKLMDMGPDTAQGTETGEHRSFDDIMDKLRRAANHEQEVMLNSGG